MSLKAGGVGLNLTAASNVFLMVHYALPISSINFVLEQQFSEYVKSFCNENLGSMVESRS